MSLGNRLYAELRGDRVIWAIVAVMAIFSILIVYSATGSLAYREQGGNTEYSLIKQVLVLGGGLVLTYLCYLMHYMKYNKMAPYLLVLAVPLLMYTILNGENINDARRWIEVPFIGITFQTSDFARLALIIYVARELTKKQDYIKDFKSAFLPIIVPVLIIVGLIAPSDLSTALLLFTTCLTMLFVGRVDVRYIFLMLFLGVVVFTFLVALGQFFPDYIRVETWISRLQEYTTDSDSGFQVQQSKIAIARGGWLGVGPGNSMQRNILPAPYSDFIFAIIIEEYGTLGAIIVVLLYSLLFFRVTRLVTISPKAFGAMLAVGLSLNLIIQAFANMAVSVNLVPVTGLTLPMISHGGTSLLFACISLGIILSVSKYIEAIQTD